MVIAIYSRCEVPTRLDRYLKRLYPLLTQSMLQKLIRKKSITIDKKRCKACTKISLGQTIQVPNNFIEYQTKKKLVIAKSSQLVSLYKKILTQHNLFEDDNILVINKPVNLVIQGCNKTTISLDYALKLINQDRDFEHQLRLVHRLDKDTSGLMIIAKNRKSAVDLCNAFRKRSISKEYTSINWGIPSKSEGLIVTSGDNVSEIESGKYENANTMCCNLGNTNTSDIKQEISEYKVLKRFDYYASQISWTLVTGKKHQIRRHAAFYLKCPIIGDKVYHDSIRTTGEKYSKMFLHSTKLVLPNEILLETRVREFFCPLPEYFCKKYVDKHKLYVQSVQ